MQCARLEDGFTFIFEGFRIFSFFFTVNLAVFSMGDLIGAVEACDTLRFLTF